MDIIRSGMEDSVPLQIMIYACFFSLDNREEKR